MERIERSRASPALGTRLVGRKWQMTRTWMFSQELHLWPKGQTEERGREDGLMARWPAALPVSIPLASKPAVINPNVVRAARL